LDYTLSVEGEGDNISRNNILRNLGDNGDETIQIEEAQGASTTPHCRIREPQQPQNLNKESGHDRKTDPDPPLALSATSNLEIATTHHNHYPQQ